MTAAKSSDSPDVFSLMSTAIGRVTSRASEILVFSTRPVLSTVEASTPEGSSLSSASATESRAEVPEEVLDFAGDALPRAENGKISVLFDFTGLRELPLRLKLDVGTAAYWSEIAATQTMDNLLAQGHIDVLEYLERVPDGYITDRQGLINAITARRAAAGAQAETA